jgi:DNA replication protein DnaC
VAAACTVCGDTGFELLEKDGREFARPCTCRAPKSPGLNGFLAESRVPARYEQCSLANFDPWSPSHTQALEKAMRYCEGYPFFGKGEGLGLLLSGTNGVGKTHLAVSVLRELAVTKGVRGQFWDFHELMREIKNSYDPATRTTEYQVLAPVIDLPLLLLDDLGAWRITDWMNDTLFYILNTRYLARRATFITTNYFDANTRQEAKNPNDGHTREFFVERIGDRLRSRLTEMCLQITIHGDDFRARQQTANQAIVLGTSQAPPDVPSPRPAATPKRPLFGG